MTAVAFDTLKFVRTLRDKAKMSPEQAEAIQGDLATKGDVTSLKSDIEALRLSTKAEIAEAKAEIIKWMIGSIGFQALIIVGAVVALSRAVH